MRRIEKPNHYGEDVLMFIDTFSYSFKVHTYATRITQIKYVVFEKRRRASALDMEITHEEIWFLADEEFLATLELALVDNVSNIFGATRSYLSEGSRKILAQIPEIREGFIFLRTDTKP